MGAGFNREKIDPELLKPSGLYESSWWESNRRSIRRSIQDRKIAPFFKPEVETDDNNPQVRPELEECPICFNLFAGGLNRAKCCTSGICTECYLQIKMPNPKTCLCPYCKFSPFEVVFTGPLSEEAQQQRLREQQRVVELQHRIRREEIERDNERQKQRMKEREEERRKSQLSQPTEKPPKTRQTAAPIAIEQVSVSSSEDAEQEMSPAARIAQNFQGVDNLDDQMAAQLEDLMLAEAIRLSLQEFPQGEEEDSASEGGEAIPPATPVIDALPEEEYEYPQLEPEIFISEDDSPVATASGENKPTVSVGANIGESFEPAEWF